MSGLLALLRDLQRLWKAVRGLPLLLLLLLLLIILRWQQVGALLLLTPALFSALTAGLRRSRA